MILTSMLNNSQHYLNWCQVDIQNSSMLLQFGYLRNKFCYNIPQKNKKLIIHKFKFKI